MTSYNRTLSEADPGGGGVRAPPLKLEILDLPLLIPAHAKQLLPKHLQKWCSRQWRSIQKKRKKRKGDALQVPQNFPFALL